MNATFFTPWIGSLYGSPNSILRKRVMVVGASHYCEHCCHDCGNAFVHPDCSVFTQDVICDYLSDNGSGYWKKTFTTYINSAFGRRSSTDERIRFLESIVFANFLQKVEGRTANEKHNEYFQEPAHVEAFMTTIHDCQPDVIVTWGSRVWNAIPLNLGFGNAEMVGDSIFRYPFEDRFFILLGLHHPAIAFPSNTSHQLLSRVGAAVL